MKTVKPYQFFASVYDEIMGESPEYRHFVPYLELLLAHYRFRPHRILDVACGTGETAVALAMNGYDVMGFDFSPEMVEEAKKKAGQTDAEEWFQVEDMRDFTVPTPFDLAISFGDSINYLTSIEDVGNAFGSVNRALRDDGMFIFDLISELHILRSFNDVTYRGSHDGCSYVWENTYDSKTNISTSTMKFTVEHPGVVGEKEYEEVHQQKIYRLDEIIAMLEQNGFTVIGRHDEFSLEPAADSERLFIVARRTKTAPGD
ncbi:MAG: class I SAM-dependent methyltransferase [Candidatus Kerfeldbacteria bacterium]